MTSTLRTITLYGGPHDGAKTRADYCAHMVIVNGEVYAQSPENADWFVHQPKGKSK